MVDLLLFESVFLLILFFRQIKIITVERLDIKSGIQNTHAEVSLNLV